MNIVRRSVVQFMIILLQRRLNNEADDEERKEEKEKAKKEDNDMIEPFPLRVFFPFFFFALLSHHIFS